MDIAHRERGESVRCHIWTSTPVTSIKTGGVRFGLADLIAVISVQRHARSARRVVDIAPHDGHDGHDDDNDSDEQAAAPP